MNFRAWWLRHVNDVNAVLFVVALVLFAACLCVAMATVFDLGEVGGVAP